MTAQDIYSSVTADQIVEIGPLLLILRGSTVLTIMPMDDDVGWSGAVVRNGHGVWGHVDLWDTDDINEILHW